MPLLEQNIAVNAQYLQNTHLEAAVLDWDKDLPELVQEFPNGFDAIMSVSLTANMHPLQPLTQLLSIQYGRCNIQH